MSAIYTIYRVFNKIENKNYIGFTSQQLKRRKRSHIYDALNDRKGNSYFHNAIREFGAEAFEWEILYQSKDLEHTRDEMEEYFIRLYDSRNRNKGYNLAKGGSANMLGYKHSYKNANLKSKSYIFVNPLGEIVNIFNMRQFCRDNNLNNGSMSQVAVGNKFHYCGWRLANSDTINIPFFITIYVIFIEDKQKSITNNLLKFCNEYNLTYWKINRKLYHENIVILNEYKIIKTNNIEINSNKDDF